jgi:hypothetical protein
MVRYISVDDVSMSYRSQMLAHACNAACSPQLSSSSGSDDCASPTRQSFDATSLQASRRQSLDSALLGSGTRCSLDMSCQVSRRQSIDSLTGSKRSSFDITSENSLLECTLHEGSEDSKLVQNVRKFFNTPSIATPSKTPPARKARRTGGSNSSRAAQKMKELLMVLV